MASRLELQTLLENILGSRNVYFQPPESTKISYPAIIYSRSRIDQDYADNDSYQTRKAYDLLVIDKNPDSIIPDNIIKLPYCSFNRHYVSDNLNHDAFTIYY